jgi:hypothetical protein
MATGENDGRVNPMHSRKIIARLQAATAPGRPAYLSINSLAGHGIRWRGTQPAANVSMITMREPQHGRGCVIVALHLRRRCCGSNQLAGAC